MRTETKRRSVVVALGLLALAIGLFVASRWASGRAHDAVRPPTLETPSAAAVAQPEPLAEPTSAERVSISAANEPAARAASEETRSLAGTLTIESFPGRRIRDPFARVAARVVGASQRSLEIEVMEGRFELEVRAGDEALEIESVQCDGWMAEPVTTRAELTGAGLDLVARWMPGVTLEVVDATSGVALPDVTVVTAPVEAGRGLSSTSTCPPTANRTTWVDSAPSPIVLPAAIDTAPVWVRAPRFAWQRIAIAGARGVRRVMLVRCGALAVVFPPGLAPTTSVELVVQAAGDGGVLLRESIAKETTGELLFEGLQPGKYSARLDGLVIGQPITLARAEFEIVAAQATRWVVEWDASNGADPATLAIRVCGERGVSLDVSESKYEVKRLTAAGDVDTRAPARSGLLKPDATGGCRDATLTALPAGRYLVTVRPWNIVRKIDIAPGAREDVEIGIGALGVVLVRVVDAQSGEPIPDAQVRFAPLESGDRAERLGPAERDVVTGAWRIVAAPGRIDVGCSASERYRGHRKPYDVALGESTLLVQLERSAALPVSFTLKQGDALYPIDPMEWVKIVLDEESSAGAISRKSFSQVGTDHSTASAQFLVTRPGVYLFRIPPSICGGDFEELIDVDVVEVRGASVTIQRK